MVAPSSVTTILTPSAAAARLATLATPVALLPVAIATQCGSLPFATDIDGAEKGRLGSVIDLNSMKRSSLAKTSLPLGAQYSYPTGTTEPDEGSSTSVYGHTRINASNKDSIEQQVDLDIKTSPSVHLSPSRNSSYNFKDGQENEAEETTEPSEKKSKEAGLDTGYDRFTERNYESYPLGWPQLAAFLNSVDNFAIFRRFGTAHCRILLHLQAEITAIEKELDELDKADSENPDMHYRLRRNEWYEGWDPRQKVLLDKLRVKLSEYDDILLKNINLRALGRAPVHDHLHVFHWIYGRKPLDKGEYDFIFHRDDFISSADQSRKGLDGLIKSCLDRWPQSRLQQFLRDKDQVHGVGDREVYIFSGAKIAFIARLMVICTSVIILLIPVFLLYLTDMSSKTTSIMVVLFVLAFATTVSLFSDASTESVFVGTCTYSAVLVTFLGNVQGKAATGGGS